MGDGILIYSVAFTALLVLLHLAAPWLRRVSLMARPGFASFSGGFAAAFVFLHMLPSLIESKDSIGAVLHSHFAESRLVDTGVFLLALLGFTIFFGLRRWCRQESKKDREKVHRSFLVSIGSFSVYNAVITFTLAERIALDVFTAAIFTLAIGLHMVIIDAEHEAHDATNFNRWGRYVLSASLVFGWGIGVGMGEHSVFAAAVLSSVLAGALLLNVFHYELSEVSDARFGSFLCGIGCGASILLLVLVFESQINASEGLGAIL